MSEEDAQTGQNEPQTWFRRPVLAAVVLLPGVALMVVAMLFAARSEIAHSEENCPYEVGEERRAPDGGVFVEERRSCEEGVEERRWRYYNAAGGERVFGVRRLPNAMFDSDAYRWAPSWSDGGLILVVENEGAETRTFREPPEM